ncbi:helix-turn-helix domain-containing protein [Vagococcus elongatus]|uniref:HTH cro/C1-type domain-containing protein n=1 Tax=Vagococcus elongatus TaxID=180344 RepID=A0A430B4A2_9ENTE|nr:helix-turn-helix transcriptional regulator [Vagococcus elongatus]RSU15167.1 hypothetical protein CBF29_02200 [Vagococcus elongatus]
MLISKNIVKYRKENNLTQNDLANELNISRQSVSKWENGETVPSIDNLIRLSGILNISLDELITGESYLSFPFDYGRPKNKVPFILLLCGVLVSALSMGSLGWLAGVFTGLIIYLFITTLSFYDFRRYYNYWTLNQKKLVYPVGQTDTVLDNIVLPLIGFLGIRKVKELAYADMKSVELVLDKYQFNPNKSAVMGSLFKYYLPRQMRFANEPFYLKITSIANEVICLDVSFYYLYYTRTSKERIYLAPVLLFFKRKPLVFIDKDDLLPLIEEKKNVFDYKDGYDERNDSAKG